LARSAARGSRIVYVGACGMRFWNRDLGHAFAGRLPTSHSRTGLRLGIPFGLPRTSASGAEGTSQTVGLGLFDGPYRQSAMLRNQELFKNMGKIVVPFACLTLVAMGGCAGPKLNLPSGAEAYARIPAPAANSPLRQYTIGPLDKLGITVFGERDLSTDQAQVDATGNLSLPLVGSIVADGKTSKALELEIRQRLVRYIVNPRVSVLVLSSVSQRVVVQGDVNEAGVYQIQGRSTLLEVLALAKGASSVSDEKRVAVFRTVDNKRMGAMFDLVAIQNLEAADPEILSGDIVVVGHSARRGAYRDFLTAAPALGLFVVLANQF
jgi:polysaccharide export outer membrane protein